MHCKQIEMLTWFLIEWAEQPEMLTSANAKIIRNTIHPSFTESRK